MSLHNLTPVEGNKELYRTPQGNIVTNNAEALRQAKLKKQKAIDNENKINKLEGEVSEIKSMLNQILEAINNK